MALTKVTSGLISADASSVDLNIDAGTLYIDSTNNRVGVGNTSPSEKLEVSGNIFINTSGNPNLTVKTSGAGNNPLIRIQADTNYWDLQTLFSNANDELDFRYNGSSKMIITSSGNVGIGTSSPDRKVSIHDTANAYNLELRQTSAYNSGNQSGIVFSAIYDSSNNPVDLASIRGGKENTTDGNYGGNLRFYTRPNGGSDSERMRITSGGTMNHYPATAATGSEYYQSNNSLALNFIVESAQRGYISVSTSGTTYSTASDYRLKENVEYDWDATTRLKQLKPARFNFISNADVTFDGFLAHEVSSIVPEAITGEQDEMQTEEYEVTPAVLDDDGNVVTEAVMGTREVPKYQGIDQSKLVPLLVKTIQELEARITALENT